MVKLGAAASRLSPSGALLSSESFSPTNLANIYPCVEASTFSVIDTANHPNCHVYYVEYKYKKRVDYLASKFDNSPNVCEMEEMFQINWT